MKRSIARVHYTSTFGVFFLLVLLFGTAWVIIEYNDLDTTLQEFDQEFVAKRKQAVKDEVSRVIAYIDFMRATIRSRVESDLRERVDEAHAVATALYDRYKGTMPMNQLQELVKNAIRPITYNQGRGYYFATRLDGVEMIFGDHPELEGRNLLDVQDTDGKPVIQDMIDLVRTQDEGFYEYTWTKPGKERKDHQKIAFIKYFKPFKWLIGTGEYLEDMEHEVKKEVLARVADIRYGNDGYLFVLRYDGVFLSHLAKEYVGKKMEDQIDANGVNVNQELIRLAKNGGGFLHYLWPRPGVPDPREKITYVAPVEPWGWVVGTGVYLEDLQAAGDSARQRFYRNVRNKAIMAVILGSIAIAITMFVVRTFTRRLDRTLTVFLDSFESAVDRGEPMATEGLVFNEFRTMAHNVNAILEKRREVMRELQKSEVRFRRVIEHSPLPMALAHGEDIEYVNSKFVKVLGYDQADVPTLQHWWQQAFPDKAERDLARRSWLQAMRKADSTGSEMAVAGQEVRCRDGQKRIMEFKGMPLGSRAVIIALDVTEQRKAEEELAKLNKDLERLVTDRTRELRIKAEELEKANEKLMALDKMKSSLLATVSHDVRTPLTSMLGFTKLIKRDMAALLELLPESNEVAARMADNLDIILNEGRRVNRLISDYLDLTRIESGVVDWKDQTLDANEVISYAMNAVRGYAENAALRFVLRSEGKLPSIRMDRDRCLQVLTNLFSNAAQYSPEGSEVVIEPTVKGEFLEVRITDYGPGIPKEECDRIFERFYRLSDTDTLDDQPQGVGLGLSICQEIVEHYGGKIWVESEENKGSTFAIWLPIA